ncbi:hypothetical protein ACIP2X_10030 [Streptomyces sp. NPDC089424]|uniref:hypothetical protein n=1 Tax=Streptomyces sp. NPDC089424 TaxID=3365917 RepID=UPI0037FFDC96
MELEHELGRIQTKSRETSSVIRRPERGESRATVVCGQCGREGVFVIQDLETTRRLRRGPMMRSLTASALIVGSTAALWIVGLAGDNPSEEPLYVLLAIAASLIFLPVGLYLAFDPTSKIGVESPEILHFDGGTRREGLTTISLSSRRGKGLSCAGKAAAAR